MDMKVIADLCARNVSALLLPRKWAPPLLQQRRRGLCVTCHAKIPVKLRDDQKNFINPLLTSTKMIPVKGDNVFVLDTPRDFYEAIKNGVRNARKRVVMAALYIGTGEIESELVVAGALADNPDLEVTMLFDALRSTRPTKESTDPRFTSSAAMLSSLLLSDDLQWRRARSFADKERLKISFYRTPNLSKLLQWLLPARINEVIGVFHVKAFIFDDHVLMTGANMSSSYFTDRQDRYIWFRDSPHLANHFCSLVDLVSSYSYTFGKDGKLVPKESLKSKDEKSLGLQLALTVNPSASLASQELLIPPDEKEEWDTLCLPTIQTGPLGIRHDEACTVTLLKHLPPGIRLQLTSPYFNLTPEYEDLLLDMAKRDPVDILVASPKANGFYGSRGLSGLIPLAYSLLEQNLFRRSQLIYGVSDATKRGLSIYEYERSGWTFHAKGLWCTLPGDSHGPSFTLVGSSNLGVRSRDRDLEAQIFLTTNNSRLIGQLAAERDKLFSRGSKVTSTNFFRERSVWRICSSQSDAAC